MLKSFPAVESLVSFIMQKLLKLTKWQFLSKLHKNVVTRPQVCRPKLIRSALESSDPGASNDGSDLQIRHCGADKEVFEVAG